METLDPVRRSPSAESPFLSLLSAISTEDTQSAWSSTRALTGEDCRDGFWGWRIYG